MNELLLSGNVAEDEVNELNELMSNVEVVQYQIKGLSPTELVDIVFHNLDVVSFTRDFILSNALNTVISQIKLAITHFRIRNKKIGTIAMHIQIKNDETKFMLYMTSNSDNLDHTISLVDNKINEIVIIANDGCTIHVNMNQQSNNIDISKL